MNTENITSADLLAAFNKMTILGSSHKIVLSNESDDFTEIFYSVSLNLAAYDMVQWLKVDSKTVKQNTCPMGKIGNCAVSCLAHSSGRNVMESNQRSKIIKTLVYYLYRDHFMQKLYHELTNLAIKSQIECFTPVVRLNCYSDLDWRNVFADFEGIQFYDYTKMYERAKVLRQIPNYDITLSYYYNPLTGQNNLKQCIEWLNMGENISAIYLKEEGMPKTWNGFETYDADKHDLRFKDIKGRVGMLSFKGTNKAKEAFKATRAKFTKYATV